MTPINDLEMTTRLYRCLRYQNIVNLEELTKIYSYEMKEWPNCGYSTLKEAATLLAAHELEFKDQPIFNTPDDFKVSESNITFLRMVADIVEKQKLEIKELKKKLESYKHADKLQKTIDELTEQLHKLREPYYKYNTNERNNKIYEAIEAGETQSVVGARYGLSKSATCAIYQREKENRRKTNA